MQTGNHARILGMFITDITEDIKPKGYDLDVVIEEYCEKAYEKVYQCYKMNIVFKRYSDLYDML